MKGLKKFLVAGCAAIAVLGLASVANAAAPSVKGTVEIPLWKETVSSPKYAWWVDPAASVIPMKNVKFSGKTIEITTNNALAKVSAKPWGAYYLPVKADAKVLPGNTTFVTWVQKQGSRYYSLETTVKFVKAETPFKKFELSGKYTIDALNKLGLGHLVTDGDIYTKDFAASFAGYRTVNFKLPFSVFNARLTVDLKNNLKAGRITATLKKNGKTIKLYNGNIYDVCKFKNIKVTYYETVASLKAQLPNYKKERAANFMGTPRTSIAKYCQIVFVR